MKEKSIASNAFYTVIYRTLNIIFPLLTTPYIARVLNPNEIGQITYTQNIVNYFVLFATLGIPVYAIRCIAREKDNLKERNKLFSEFFVINFISNIVALVLYYIYIWLACEANEDRSIQIIMSLLLLFNCINIDWLFQGLEEFRYITTRGIVVRLIVIFALFIFVKDSNDLLKYALILCIPTCIGNLINLVFSKRYVHLQFSELSILHHFKPILFLFANTVSYELYSRIDITILGNMCESDVVGYYSYAQRIINLAIIAITSVTYVFLPRLSAYISSDWNKFCELIKKGFCILLFVTIPAIVGLILVGNDLVMVLFGEKFRKSIVILQLFSPLILIKSFQDLGYQILIATNNEKKILWGYLAATLTNTTLDILLVPLLGSNGAVIATLVGEILVTLYILLHAKSYIKHTVSKQVIFAIFVSTAIMTISIRLLNSIISVNWVRLICDIIAGSLIYFGCNYILKNEIVIELKNSIMNRISVKGNV